MNLKFWEKDFWEGPNIGRLIFIAVILSIGGYIIITMGNLGYLSFGYNLTSVTDISAVMHKDLSETNMNNLIIICSRSDGSWVDTITSVVCYDMLMFDTSICENPSVIKMKTRCHSIENAKWSCDNKKFGCYHKWRD